MKEEYFFYIDGYPDLYENEESIMYWNGEDDSFGYVIFQKDKQTVKINNITEIRPELCVAIMRQIIGLNWKIIEDLEWMFDEC